MFQILLKKTGSFLIIIIGITFLSFILSYLSPGDPASIMLKKGGNMVSEEVVQQKREELGLDSPMVEQYFRWLKGILKGDFGTSYRSKKSVVREITESLPYTILLTVSSLLLTMLIAIPLGLLSAKFKDGWLDNALRMITYLFSSLPSFFVALVLMYIFSLKLKLLPVIAKGNRNGMVMPMLVLALTLAAWYIRQVRAIVLSELGKEYVEGLLTRGVSEMSILFRHVLRNCLAPIITLTGLSFGTMLGGSTIVESIFSWPGVGKMAVDAITARDYPVIQGYVLWMAVIVVLINALVEIICSLLDPRIRRGRMSSDEA
ncbi:MAG: ABC transporter permease [Eubacteriales bacterium]|nr:ABC transporter permease [Eubacteriales bacterium]